MLKLNSSSKCLICQEILEIESFTACNCEICYDCFYEWIKTKNEETLHLSEEFFSCPNHSCKKIFEKDWILTKLKGDELKHINEILLKKYLNSNNDIIKCPRNECNYAGFQDDKYCSDQYICTACNKEWNPNVLQARKIFILGSQILPTLVFYLRIFFSYLLEEYSELRINLLYKPCFHCNRFVDKYVGCNHIVCSCKKEFCYFCLGNWINHKDPFCSMKKDIFGCFSIIISFLFIFKGIISFGIFIFCVKQLIWLGYLQLCAVILVYISFKTFMLLYIFNFAYKKPYWRLNVLSYFPLFFGRLAYNLFERYPFYIKFISFIIPISYSYLLYYLFMNFDFINFLIKFILGELFFFSLIVLLYVLRHALFFLVKFVFGVLKFFHYFFTKLRDCFKKKTTNKTTSLIKSE